MFFTIIVEKITQLSIFLLTKKRTLFCFENFKIQEVTKISCAMHCARSSIQKSNTLVHSYSYSLLNSILNAKPCANKFREIYLFTQMSTNQSTALCSLLPTVNSLELPHAPLLSLISRDWQTRKRKGEILSLGTRYGIGNRNKTQKSLSSSFNIFNNLLPMV
uniref:Uncharacterized protein n=1 Tax=Cacopsylla melanoneura TaxID=428564 RepID=A0A8D8Y4U6_9HEMI